MAIWGYLRYTKSSPNARKVTHLENTWKEFMRTWRRRKETLGVFSLYARRYKSVYISVNNNTNLNLFKILSDYFIWDRLSQKTISRYCPFNWESFSLRSGRPARMPYNRNLWRRTLCLTTEAEVKQAIKFLHFTLCIF
jgi:hypothetical protein